MQLESWVQRTVMLLALWFAVGPALGQNVTDPQAPHPSSVYTVDCTRPVDHDAADLCEQKRQAKAGEDAAWWASAQTVVSAAGFLAVLLSLLASIGATKAATQTAQTAVDALKGSRAWLQFETFEAYPFQNGRFDDEVIDEGTLIRLILRNAGSTPAVQVNLHRLFAVVPHNAPVPNFTVPSVELHNIRVGTLGPGARASSTHIPLAKADFDDVLALRKDLYVYALARYHDVFDPNVERLTELCMILSPEGTRVWPSGESRPHFTFAVAGPQNLSS